MTGRRLATIVTSAALACPGAALAQSAGDDEYQDPIPGPGTTPAQPTAPAAEPEPAAAAPAQAEPEPGTPVATPAQAAEELPRTGVPVAIVGGAGVLLLAGGASLRRRL